MDWMFYVVSENTHIQIVPHLNKVYVSKTKKRKMMDIPVPENEAKNATNCRPGDMAAHVGSWKIKSN